MVVYIIRNKVNNKKYVGQTRQKQPKRRWYHHRTELNKNIHCNFHLQKSYNKYGKDSFEFIIIDSSAKNLIELDNLENFYIEKYKTLDGDFGYNRRNGGNSSMVFTELQIKQISERAKEMWQNSEYRKRGLKQIMDAMPTPEEKSENMKALWKLPEFRNQIIKTYDGFVSPEGIIHSPVKGIREFAKQHHLHHGELIKVYNEKINHSKGWIKYIPAEANV